MTHGPRGQTVPTSHQPSCALFYCVLRSFAVTGNVGILAKLHTNGYAVREFASGQSPPSSPSSPPSRREAAVLTVEAPPLVSSLARFGHLVGARELLSAFPALGSEIDAWGVPASALVAALEESSAAEWRHVPEALLGAALGAPAIPRGLPLTAEVAVTAESAAAAPPPLFGTGGWPTFELPFPGWDSSGSNGGASGGGQSGCEVAELSGAAVAADPVAFVQEFVLKRRPVVLRDFVRHDKVIISAAAASKSFKPMKLTPAVDMSSLALVNCLLFCCLPPLHLFPGPTHRARFWVSHRAWPHSW